MVNGGLRVAIIATTETRLHDLAERVAAAGHSVVTDGAQLVLVDTAADVEAIDDILRNATAQIAAAPAEAIPEALAELGAEQAGFRAVNEAPAALLTPRESEILAALGEGMSNKEVARALGISAHTVKFHLETIFRKLDVTSRAEAVAKGLRQGMIEL